jgi:hypothetical protein
MHKIAKYSAFFALMGCLLSVTPAKSHEIVEATAINHSSQEICVAPQKLWQLILDQYLNGGQFSNLGYEISSLEDDLAAFRGGYRMTFRDDKGTIVDDRMVYITERNDAARRLSIFAQYLSPSANGLEVHATYQAVPSECGALYNLSVHSQMNFPTSSEEGAKPSIQAAVEEMQNMWQKFLDERLLDYKKQLEASPEG